MGLDTTDQLSLGVERCGYCPSERAERGCRAGVRCEWLIQCVQFVECVQFSQLVDFIALKICLMFSELALSDGACSSGASESAIEGHRDAVFPVKSGKAVCLWRENMGVTGVEPVTSSV